MHWQPGLVVSATYPACMWCTQYHREKQENKAAQRRVQHPCISQKSVVLESVKTVLSPYLSEAHTVSNPGRSSQTLSNCEKLIMHGNGTLWLVNTISSSIGVCLIRTGSTVQGSNYSTMPFYTVGRSFSPPMVAHALL